MVKLKNKSAPLAIVLLTMVLRIGPVPVRAYEVPVLEDIQHTVYDPTDDIHIQTDSVLRESANHES